MLNVPLFTHITDPAQICANVFAWARGIFVYVTDERQYGLGDHWPSPQDLADNINRHDGELHDDCDGFACLCRYALRLNGVKSRLVLCWVEGGGGYHAVAEANGLVLDNRQVAVCSTQDLERIGYVWDRMSGYETGDPWVDVKFNGEV